MPAPALDASIGKKTLERGQSAVKLDAKEAVDLANYTDENVFLFVPNLIGYARIVLAAVALNFMPYSPRWGTLLYGVSCLLDALDGHAARALGQTSRFGAVLDMITDRCTTSGLLVYLSSAYPRYALAFQALISLDFASHYIHMYSTLVTGSRSHKAVEDDVSRILRFYYNNPKTLFMFCAGNELFFVALYLMKWDRASLGLSVFPAWTTAYVPGIAQWLADLTFAQVLAMICFPICFGKNVINVVQGWKASKILVGIDVAERIKARTQQQQSA